MKLSALSALVERAKIGDIAIATCFIETALYTLSDRKTTEALVWAVFWGFVYIGSRLSDVVEAIRKHPPTKVNVYDCRMQTRADGDEWKQ